MKINDFKLEVFFTRHEFTAPHLLAQSDCESMPAKELLALEPGAEEIFLKTWLGYTQVPGSPELRESVAGLYQNIDMDHIIIHAGAQEAIFNFMNIFLKRGDHIITQFPVYQSLYEIAKSIGCSISKWQIRQSEKGWFMNPDDLEKLIRPETRLICINTPNNPTGYAFSEAQMIHIAEIADRHGLYVFSDEVYKGLELNKIKSPWFADIYEKAVSLGVMSKAYGLAGLRIGWIAARDREILEKMIKMKHYTSICSSSLSENLAIIALRHGNAILKKNIGIIKNNLEISDKFFSRNKELFLYNRPMAGPIAFHKINIDMPVLQFCNDLIEKKGVLLLPGDVFDYQEPYFRMGYGRGDFSENLEVFEEYLDENQDKLTSFI